ncbi:MAG: alpha-E domain-containing protein [Planctomycetes bacterium]|nr:alpha-E domain-containing protein [Planctomycetota bacterium]
MLSRVADSVYWMNRQIERAENVARAVETTLDLALDGTISPGRLWNALVCTFGDEADFWARFGLADQANVISFLAFDQTNPNSIASCLQAARENARTVRDMISTPMWEEINKAHLYVRSAAAANAEIDHPREFLDEVKRASQLITGVADATMSHGEAWHFARMGRLIERADKTSRVLDVEHYFQPAAVRATRPAGGAADESDEVAVQWSAVLESASALEMYRKVHGAVSRRSVADFLIFDREFPRAMHFCLIKAEESLLAITGGSKGSYTNPAEQRLGRLRSNLNYGAIDEILGAESGLHGFIDGFQTSLNQASEAIFATFFALQPVGSSGQEA